MSRKKNINLDVNEVKLNILRSLYSNPDSTQRKLSSNLGVSLGSVNYCIKALVDKGFLKVQKFKNSKTKQKYFYILTSKGIIEKTRLTFSFLEKKHAEYLLLYHEIEKLKSELKDNNSESLK